MSGTFRINTPHVINEVIDGEAVVVNLATGGYFSLRGSGAYTWSAVAQHASTAEIVGALVTGGMPAPDAEKGVADLQDLILLDPVHEVDERGWPHDPTAS
jgi:hypothetical protein